MQVGTLYKHIKVGMSVGYLSKRVEVCLGTEQEREEQCDKVCADDMLLTISGAVLSSSWKAQEVKY